MLCESASSSRDSRKLLRFFLAARELHFHYLEKYPVTAEVNSAVREKLASALLQHAYRACDPAVADAMYKDYAAHSSIISFDGSTKHTWDIILSAISWAVLSLDETQSETTTG